ncbi:cytochrome P450 [Nocardia tenerifensis]|uniref:Cytochrome P450 n=1 Tax=Nocardia tenerifensis TaxID=228006 RepID=A0A318KPR4_9NOCA|nr:cytochrome P450 [Nocardia tenerifensis]PXX71650.1 cytochrome P450 [Nocardia tenerifensis]
MHPDIDRVLLYSPEFAADPHRAYAAMRAEYGPLVPVELAPQVPATLVIGYHTALRILHDPEHFPADPRSWQHTVPADSAVLPLLEWRPNALRSSGAEHARYRVANTSAINGVDLGELRDAVDELATALIDRFRRAGTADLVREYAQPLAFGIVNRMLGCPAEIGERIARGMVAIFEGDDAAQGNRLLTEALMELVEHKRAEPGADITTSLLNHQVALDDLELVHQLVVLYGAGIEPLQNLILNALLLILDDDRFGGDLLGGSLSTRDALDEVLFTDPPMANFCVTYPRQPVLIDGVWLPAHQPVVISMAAGNNDPAIRADDRTGNRSHLAWSAGPHACPARSAAYLVAQEAVDQLLDILPDLELATPASELVWRPGPFHRALATLPVRFPPVSALPR